MSKSNKVEKLTSQYNSEDDQVTSVIGSQVYEDPESREYKIKQNKYIKWIYQLDNLGIETRGIERVTPQERKEISDSKKHSRFNQLLHVSGLWFAACGGLTSMSSFFLPTLLYGLNLRDSLISGLIAMILGCLVPAYTSTMGSKSGCRQMVSARFLFGQWGTKFVAIVCIVGGIGWSVVNCVVGGQVLAAISGVGLAVGIVVICIITLVIAVFGIKVLLKFQTLLSIPIGVAIILFYVVVCKKIEYVHKSNALVSEQNYSSATSRGNWLSFFTIGYSVTATWGSGASDYYILFPEDTSSYEVFFLTFLGITIPTTFVAIVATICGSIAYTYKPWNDAYNAFGIGGLLSESFKPWGKFGKFIVVILYLSLVCNNVMNTYSAALECQLIDERFTVVPRWLWALLVTVIYLVLSIAGKSEFSNIIGNFLPMLGYWISMYIVLLLEENLIFRTSNRMKRLHYKEFDDHQPTEASMDEENLYNKNVPVGSWVYMYNWEKWNQPQNITLGLAAAVAFAAGVAGAVLGMNQVYYRGPLAQIGDYGGDIGFWLAMAFSGVVYPGLRYLELRKFGR